MAKKRSMKQVMYRYSALLILLFVIFFVILIMSMSFSLRNAAFDGASQTMKLYSDDVEENLRLTSSVMILNSVSNTDISRISLGDDAVNLTIEQVRVKSLLNSVLGGMTNTDGVFLYAPNTDIYIAEAKRSGDPCNTYLRGLLRREEVDDLVSVEHWTLRLLKGRYYLVNIMDLYNCYAGAWVSLDTLTTAFSKLDTSAIYLYTDAEGRILGDTERGRLHDPIQAQKKPVTIEYNGDRYLQISKRLSFCDYYLTALIPVDVVYDPVHKMSSFMLLGLLLLLILVVITTHLTRRLFVRPVHTIEETASKLSTNDYTLLLPVSDQDFEEISQLHSSVNGLLVHATELQQQVYEEKLRKTEFELQYLKSQVAPHFLINCFSAIGAIPDTEEGKKTRAEMIRTLSEHLRYALGQRQNVSLGEELYYVENYLALSALRFPDCLRYQINAPEEIRVARVFPLLILMLTENAIKHNLIMGEEFYVQIDCMVEEDASGRKLLHIVHLDSGSGYPEEMLQSLNNVLIRGKKEAEDGHHLGIYNVSKRAEILYHLKEEEVQKLLHFSNRSEGGARCDILIPYEINEEMEMSGSGILKDGYIVTQL